MLRQSAAPTTLTPRTTKIRRDRRGVKRDSSERKVGHHQLGTVASRAGTFSHLTLFRSLFKPEQWKDIPSFGEFFVSLKLEQIVFYNG